LAPTSTHQPHIKPPLNGLIRVGHAFREPLLNPSGMEGMLIWGAGGKLMFREGPGQLRISHHFPSSLDEI